MSFLDLSLLAGSCVGTSHDLATYIMGHTHTHKSERERERREREGESGMAMTGGSRQICAALCRFLSRRNSVGRSRRFAHISSGEPGSITIRNDMWKSAARQSQWFRERTLPSRKRWTRAKRPTRRAGFRLSGRCVCVADARRAMGRVGPLCQRALRAGASLAHSCADARTATQIPKRASRP